jgi:gliding motility-associated-like protein
MKKNFLLFAFILIAYLSSAQFVASDLSYTTVGNKKYSVKLEIYTECSTDGGLLINEIFPIYVNSSKLKTELKGLKFDNGTPKNELVRLYCSDVLDNCGNFNSLYRGLRKTTFYKTLDLSGYPATDDWEVSFFGDYKDKIYTFLNLPEKYGHGNSTIINTSITNNSSPTFSENPILKTCQSVTDTINLGILDNDKDSLVFSLDAPVSEINKVKVVMDYKSGYSYLKPLNVASDLIITKNGKLILKSTNKGDVGAVDVIIDEYRNGVKIATTRRNIQINVFDCANNAPTISDFVTPQDPNNKTQITICSGDTLTKVMSLINLIEPDANQKISSVQIIPRDFRLNGLFTFRSKNDKEIEVYSNNGIVFSTNKDETVTFDVKVTDSGCPNDLTTIKTFTILVKARPTFNFNYDLAYLNCSPYTVLKPSNQTDFNTKDNIRPQNLSGNAPYTYLWKYWDRDILTNKNIIKNPNVFPNNSSIDQLEITKQTGVTVIVTDRNGCTNSDSIYLTNGFVFNDPVITNRCWSNDSSLFVDNAYTIDPTDSIIERKWTFSDGSVFITKKTSFKKKFCAPGLYAFKHEVKNSKGCIGTYDDSLRIHPTPIANFFTPIQCSNRLVIFDSTNYLPTKGGATANKSYGYASAEYYVSKVFNGLDTNIEKRLQTSAQIKFVCDSAFVFITNDSAALDCSKYNITPKKTIKFKVTNTLNLTFGKLFTVKANGANLEFVFNKFTTTEISKTPLKYDTTIISTLATQYVINDIFRNLIPESGSILMQDQPTGAFVKCNQYVSEDDLRNEVLITEHPSIQADDYIFPNLRFTWEKQNNRLQADSGNYIIRQIVTSTAGCTAETFKKVKIYPEPKVAISNRFRVAILPDTITQNCSKADTTLYAKILANKNGGLRYSWLFNPSENQIDNGVLTSIDSIKAGPVGTSYLYVKDSKNCDDTVKVSIKNYLNPDFSVLPSCSSDTIIFTNNSSANGGPKLKESFWIVKDAAKDTLIESFIDNRNSFKKLYGLKGDITITLVLKDSLSCTKDITTTIYRSFFNDIFSLPTSRSLCATDKINATSIELTSQSNHIDSLIWNLGDGRKVKQTIPPTGPIGSFQFTYPNDSVYAVSFKVYYNGRTELYLDSTGQTQTRVLQPTCVYVSDTKNINIRPEFKGELFSFRNCTSDTSEFIFEKDPSIGDSTVKVTKIDWKVEARSNQTEAGLTFPLIRQDNYSFKYKFLKERELKIVFTATDQNGCIFKDSTDATIDALGLPIITFMDTACFGTESTIKLRSENKTLDGTIRRAFDYGLEYKKVEFASGEYKTAGNTETIKYIFPNSGKLNIKAYMIKRTSQNKGEKSILTDKIRECRGVLDTTIYVRPIPAADFSTEPVCAKSDTTKFKNLTKFTGTTKDAKDSTIVSYSWNFGDGSEASSLKNPGHVYSTGGTKSATLTVTNAHGCNAVKTQDVLVKNTPTAYFTTSPDSSLLEISNSVSFQNQTTPIETNKYLWEFGDGTTSIEKNPEDHKYNELKRYTVKLTATNKDGCTDTYTKPIELRPVLLLPNVFTPNGDGNNDDLFLIYKLIDELDEFKIYNRWGEVVFDAYNNLNKKWDGTYKGTDQEIGVYVAYVKAKGKYGYNFNFKQNITLLR